MRTPKTFTELSLLSDAEFLAFVKVWKEGWQYEHASAWRYAAHRLANIQGLIVVNRKNETTDKV